MNKLKGKIAEAGLSQRKVADYLHISKNTLNAKINGKKPFNTNEIRSLCELLHIESCEEKSIIFLD